MAITLTSEECKAVFEMICMMSGHNPEYVFTNDGKDSLTDPATAAFCKLYREANQISSIPANLR